MNKSERGASEGESSRGEGKEVRLQEINQRIAELQEVIRQARDDERKASEQERELFNAPSPDYAAIAALNEEQRKKLMDDMVAKEKEVFRYKKEVAGRLQEAWEERRSLLDEKEKLESGR